MCAHVCFPNGSEETEEKGGQTDSSVILSLDHPYIVALLPDVSALRGWHTKSESGSALDSLWHLYRLEQDAPQNTKLRAVHVAVSEHVCERHTHTRQRACPG